MAKLRHIAINVDDLEKEAAFYINAFELKEMGRAGDITKAGAIYLSDGTINLALIRIPDKSYPNYNPRGLNHLGFVVDDLDVAIDRAEKAGAVATVDRNHRDAGATWEMKMVGPGDTGIAFDLSDHGWPGITL
jgi:catechol 2,3-dioxygenase-like lactoylglutathione lyase family enzyme